jgi:hypothetical protein
MRRDIGDPHRAVDDPRQQIVAILVSGLRRYVHQSKLKRLNSDDFSEQRLEFSHDPRLSVSQHVGTPSVTRSQAG